MHILHVVGARPNFMKVAPVMRAFAAISQVEQTLVHTGQHYDANMSDVFFEQLDIPRPDVFLGVGSASHAAQTAEIMIRFEQTVLQRKPDWVMVYGDVNSTAAASLVCSKLNPKVAHVEAGLRSFDRRMPEEINRLVTDQLADWLLTPSKDANENLIREGIRDEKIRCVGNVMIDTLCHLLPKARTPENAKTDDPYALVTLHRPSNVDDKKTLEKIVSTLGEISQECQLFFPLHPRTRDRMKEFGISLGDFSAIEWLEPIGYLECLALQKDAQFVITDSGGLQEETTYLQVPCLTLRENTERPVTLDQGTNILIGKDMALLKTEVRNILNGKPKQGKIPELWDGKTGQRIAEIFI